MSSSENPNDELSQRLPEKIHERGVSADDRNQIAAGSPERMCQQELETRETEMPDSQSTSTGSDLVAERADEVVVAEPVDTVIDAQPISDPAEQATRSYMDVPPRAIPVQAPPVDFNQKRLMTKGGAVGGLVLGGLSVVGSFLTGYSFVNATLGFLLSAWGLQSSARRLAIVGMLLSIAGMFLSIALSVS